ncbi:MAG: S15 peptidase family protein [Thermoplasmatota archaeon]
MKTLTLGILAIAAFVAIPPGIVPGTAASSNTIQTGVLTSFDGTPIVYTLFMPASAAQTPVPVVLMTHGWAGSRQTTADGIVGAFLAADMGVLTWDSRGFGQSGGLVELDSPSYEVRDASALITMLASNPEVKTTSPGVPDVGMTGSSYAGGIQLLTAAFDPRIVAITPDITWNDLRQSLGPGGVIKEDWVQVLFASGLATSAAYGLEPGNPAGPQAGAYDTNLPLWYAEVHATNGLTPDVNEGLRERSPSQYLGQIHAATLFTQGLPDSLFPPNEAMANYRGLVADGTPARMVLYCGGHAGCPYVSNDSYVQSQVVSWLTSWLWNDAAPAAMPNFQWFDNVGTLHSASSWPPSGATTLTASGTLQLVSTPAPTGGGEYSIGAGGVSGAAGTPVLDNGVGSGIIPIPGAGGHQVTGIGHVHIAVTGVGTEAFLFFRLVDMNTGAVLDNQTQAYRIPVSPLSTSEANVDLIGVSYQIPAGHTLGLEISTSDFAHATNRQPGAYTVHTTVTVASV